MGNNKLVVNSTQIPNIILDEWMPNLSGTELMVVMTIARQTYGWHKESDHISYSQLAQKTGASNGAIGNALKSLKEKGLVKAYQNIIGKGILYCLNITSPKNGDHLSKKWNPKNGDHLSKKWNPKNGDTKETITKETKQKKEIDREKTLSFLKEIPEKDIHEFTTAYKCSESQLKSKADDLYNYCVAHGKKYSNYKAMLRNAVKKDFGVRPVMPKTATEVMMDISAQQRIENIERIAGMRAKLRRVTHI